MAIVYGAVAFVVAQAADIAFPAVQLPAWTVTLVVVLALAGFPLALVLAWAFEVTPDGIRREIDSVAGSPVAARRRAGTLVVAGVAIPMAVGIYALSGKDPAGGGASGTTARDNGAHPAAIRSIAVIPFVNMSPDRDNEYFSDGLTEELLNGLAQIEGLRVAARTSSFAFKGVSAPVMEIGRQLNVETVLEGSVRRTGNRIRITAQLIDAADGFHLWSRTYDREISDVFEIQDEISRAILTNIMPRFTDLEVSGRSATSDVEAYELYLRGKYEFWQGESERNFRSAASFFRAAIDRDPTYAAAYAGLADAQMLLARHVPPGQVMPDAKAAALRALELDPQLAEGYVALASINWFYDLDWAAAERNYRRSFSVNRALYPRCICYVWYLVAVGSIDEAVLEAERARALDPIAPLPASTLAQVYFRAGRFDDARAELSALEAMGSSSTVIPRFRAWMDLDEGRAEHALAAFERLRGEWDERGSFAADAPALVVAELAYLYGAAGLSNAAAELARALAERASPSYVPPEHVAAAYAAAGNRAAPRTGSTEPSRTAPISACSASRRWRARSGMCRGSARYWRRSGCPRPAAGRSLSRHGEPAAAALGTTTPQSRGAPGDQVRAEGPAREQSTC